jgi:hypothetical protein
VIRKVIPLIAIFILFACDLKGQQISSMLLNESIEEGKYDQFNYRIPYKIPKKKNPKTATILSAIVPGAGQVYNGKAWKVPLIYAGLGGFGYGIYWNRNEMKQFQDELNFRFQFTSDTSKNFQNLSVAQLKSNRDFYRSNRDLSMVGFVIMYALNIVDATVDAHLSEFRIDDNLSMGIEPKIIDNRNLGFGLTLRF